MPNCRTLTCSRRPNGFFGAHYASGTNMCKSREILSAFSFRKLRQVGAVSVQTPARQEGEILSKVSSRSLSHAAEERGLRTALEHAASSLLGNCQELTAGGEEASVLTVGEVGGERVWKKLVRYPLTRNINPCSQVCLHAGLEISLDAQTDAASDSKQNTRPLDPQFAARALWPLHLTQQIP